MTIFLFQVLIHLIECHHDYHVIRSSRHDRPEDNRRWHQYDSVMWILVHFGLTMNPLYLISGLAIRLLVLQVYLNHIRGLPLTYLSDKGIDGFMKKNFGPRLTLSVKVLLLVASLSLIIHDQIR